jgi:hypothetical protein
MNADVADVAGLAPTQMSCAVPSPPMSFAQSTAKSATATLKMDVVTDPFASADWDRMYENPVPSDALAMAVLLRPEFRCGPRMIDSSSSRTPSVDPRVGVEPPPVVGTVCAEATDADPTWQTSSTLAAKVVHDDRLPSAIEDMARPVACLRRRGRIVPAECKPLSFRGPAAPFADRPACDDTDFPVNAR